MIFITPLILIPSSLFSTPLRFVSSAPTTIGIPRHPHVPQLLTRSKYFSSFSFWFSLYSPQKWYNPTFDKLSFSRLFTPDLVFGPWFGGQFISKTSRIIIVIPLRIFHTSVAQISRTLLSIQLNINNVVVWMVSTCPLISKFPVSILLVTVQSAPITMGNTVTFMLHRFFSSFAMSRHLSHFSLSFCF